MTLEFLHEASAEFLEAVLYYEGKEPELGMKFLSEVDRVCDSIVTDPLLWREREGGYRRVNCPVFPYYVAYFIRGEKIIIAAVAHAQRKPEYWKDRLR
jgi:plasmid stabilization system protein ParE